MTLTRSEFIYIQQGRKCKTAEDWGPAWVIERKQLGVWTPDQLHLTAHKAKWERDKMKREHPECEWRVAKYARAKVSP